MRNLPHEKTPSRAHILRQVSWQDLVAMRPTDGIVECLHPLPWFAASIAFAANGWFLAAMPCTFMFFLTGLRLNHEAIHRNLGFGKAGHHAVLHGLSMLMLCSNHSVAWNHLEHHRHAGKPTDLEGKAGRMNFLQVVFYGPLFAWETHRHAWVNGGSEQRRRMLVDGAVNLVIPALAFTLWSPALAYHLVMMVGAQSLTAFFAVWITHHGCEDHVLVARTQRNRWVNLASYNMFFHLEHHLFPAVPVKRLALLAERLDAAFPTIIARTRRVVPGQA
ncbi:fatty acid desaturase family protein [Alteraurantiacibacter aquimixticola]|uniref:Fatty acid desaturase n=1 Tax=Alteraurantiacibacter aquimixticola TaxID=2489173 RepID=A0A4T3EZC4_9SPHN|nr:fatty acid desaturase [Alteraurantiacibacter aquimixticola]TIX50121.1 fatty acid desaturase [Alteraurantiacibacter aquimixticola]